MRRYRRSSKRFRRAKREYVWTSTFSAGPGLTQGGTVFDEVTIVSPLDWQRGQIPAAGVQKGAVVVRIVGDVWFFQDPSGDVANLRSINNDLCTVGVLKRDQDDTSVLDINTDALAEDWMHLEQVRIDTFYTPTATLTAGWGQPNARVHLDMRVKRKLTTEDVIKLCLLAERRNLDTEVNASFLLRSLIQLP